MPRFANVELTPESMQACRQWFAQNALDCIFEIASGEVYANNLESCYDWRMRHYHDALSGRNDHTFTFLQRAHYIQTGECIALLP